jgi:hypothetical protein
MAGEDKLLTLEEFVLALYRGKDLQYRKKDHKCSKWFEFTFSKDDPLYDMVNWFNNREFRIRPVYHNIETLEELVSLMDQKVNILFSENGYSLVKFHYYDHLPVRVLYRYWKSHSFKYIE